MFIFETFPVYQLADRLYKEIVPYIKSQKVDYVVIDQLQRALLSVILNIAEGSGKYTKKEKRNFYLIARGSCHESAALMMILRTHNIDMQLTDNWYKKLVVIGKMLTGMIKAFNC